ncbi:hypothetical protein LOTGIDRAFT_233191 [Lottia gigantea]|uniref:Uncharacterized protein n=1 Tax=Lottia gigantea TaxID=225164 RepID=V4A6W4_LOTGI|nr:hypothetical protein LOTGIDRAFT_233191 [Lottia gigantea]ESO92452.1 hypothetical protein LOTGIDRAFT_233191 [Lottia gigantea]
MAKFGEKQFSGGKREKKEPSRKKTEKIVPICGWDPIQLEDDCDISTWMQWQRDRCFVKRKPTELDLYRNLSLDKCSSIDDVGNFEYASLADRFQKNPQHFKQFNSENISENIRRNSAEEKHIISPKIEKKSHRIVKSAGANIASKKTEISAIEIKTQPAEEIPQKPTESQDTVKPNASKDGEEAEELQDDGYESKTSCNDETNSGEIRPVPLLDLADKTADREGNHVGDNVGDNETARKSSSFRWLREQDDSVNKKVVKVTYAQNNELTSSVYRHNIINSSRAFVTNYIKRYYPKTNKSQLSTGDRPSSLVLSRVGIQDSNEVETPQTVAKIHNTSPDLNVSNLVTRTVVNRSAGRPSSRNRVGSYKSVKSVDSDGQYFPMKDLLPAVDQNIQDKQLERYTKHSVEEYYGKIGCGDKQISSIEAISRSLDKHIGPPPFRPHYLRSPLQRAREQSNKKVNGKIIQLPDGSETYRVCTPRYYIEKTVKSRAGSADRPARVKLCLFGSSTIKSAEARRTTPRHLSARTCRERTIQTTNIIKRMMKKK